MELEGFELVLSDGVGFQIWKEDLCSLQGMVKKAQVLCKEPRSNIVKFKQRIDVGQHREKSFENLIQDQFTDKTKLKR